MIPINLCINFCAFFFIFASTHDHKNTRLWLFHWTVFAVRWLINFAVAFYCVAGVTEFRIRNQSPCGGNCKRRTTKEMHTWLTVCLVTMLNHNSFGWFCENLKIRLCLFMFFSISLTADFVFSTFRIDWRHRC